MVPGKRSSRGGGQNLERSNVERPIFRKFETSNIEKTKVQLFGFLKMYFLYLRLFELFEDSKYMIIYQIGNFWNFESFTNFQVLKIR